MLTIRESIVLCALSSVCRYHSSPLTLNMICRVIAKIESNVIPSEFPYLIFLEDAFYIANTSTLDEAKLLIDLDLKKLVKYGFVSSPILMSYLPTNAGLRYSEYFLELRLARLANVINCLGAEFISVNFPNPESVTQKAEMVG